MAHPLALAGCRKCGFAALNGGSQSLVTPVPGDPITLMGNRHASGTHIYIPQNSHTHEA